MGNRRSNDSKQLNGEGRDIYHCAKTLLQIYSKTAWITSNKYSEILDSNEAEYGINDINGLEIIATFDESAKTSNLVDDLLSVGKNKLIIDIVKDALIKLKTYPNHGELYHSIISKNYLDKYKYTESEILESLNMARTTYYRKRKDAINIFGVCLWKMTIPSVLNIFDMHSYCKCV